MLKSYSKFQRETWTAYQYKIILKHCVQFFSPPSTDGGLIKSHVVHCPSVIPSVRPLTILVIASPLKLVDGF